MLRGATIVKLLVLFVVVIAMNVGLFLALRGDPLLKDQLMWWAVAIIWATVACVLAFVLSRGVEENEMPTAGTGLMGGVFAQLALLGAVWWWQGSAESRPPTGEQATFELPDSAQVGATIGTVKFEAGNPGKLHYEIVHDSDSGSWMFAIDRETGTLRLADTRMLDAQSWPWFVLEIRATDDYGASGTTLVRVTITDANQPPVIRGAPIELSSYARPDMDLGFVFATDQDGDSLSYAIVGGNESGLFVIDERSGRMHITDASKLPRESTQLDVQIEVTDGKSPPVREMVRIDFTHIREEPPIFDGPGSR